MTSKFSLRKIKQTDLDAYVDIPLDSEAVKSLPTSLFHVIAFFLFGIAALLPWNAFCTNIPYFEKAMGKSLNLQRVFSSTMTVCSMIPLLIANFINVFWLCRYEPNLRVKFPQFLNLAGFIIITTAIGLKMTGGNLFALIMFLSIYMNTCSPIFNSALYSEVSLFEFRCFTAFNAGQSFAGIVVSLIQIILISTSLSDDQKAIIYFCMAQFFILLSIVCYFYITLSPNYKKLLVNHPRSSSKTLSPLSEVRKLMAMLMKKFKTGLALYLTLAVTLFIFPKLLTYIKTSADPKSSWAYYFLTVNAFLIFNTFDFFGRYLNSFIKWPKPDSWSLLILSVSRIIFVPLLMMCNQDHWPSMSRMKHDLVPMFIVALFGLTNGHLITICFTAPYTLKDPEERNYCSTVYVLVLGFGLASGSFPTFLY